MLLCTPGLPTDSEAAANTASIPEYNQIKSLLFMYVYTVFVFSFGDQALIPQDFPHVVYSGRSCRLFIIA